MKHQILPPPAMRKTVLYACALLALTSCSNDEFVGDQSLMEGNGEKAISFNYQFQNATRGESDHTTSAANLGNQFIVWGEKSTGASDTKDAPAAGHIVFPNYQVNYAESSAYNTTSNTKDWEYVGYTHSSNYQSNIKYKATASDAVSGSDVAQTIKYWDYSAGSYTFTAVSASKLTDSKTDIENGYVTIQKNIDDDDKASEKGYTVTVTANADLTKLYFSDRTVITASAGTDRNANNTYGGNVTLKFRNALSQIRAGIYETIPGYDISDIHFFVTSDVEAKVSSTDAFGAICPNIKGTGYTGNLTVTYSEETATLNQPMVSASVSNNNDLILGTNTNTISTSNTLKTTSADPTWDTDGGTFTTVLLNGSHTTSLKLKCNYTLYNSVSGETINVTGATAEVPYQYLQWKPNYKYTYLFKISPNTNGVTNPSLGPSGLYPITFDAVEITNGDGVAEYITTVSEPSITTFGVVVNTSDVFQTYQTGKDEYQLPGGTDKLDLYAAIMDGSTAITPNLGTNVNIYKNVSTSDANFPVTEASLAEAIAESGTSEKISYTLDNTIAAVRSGADAANGIPSEDGNTITGLPAIKLTNIAAGTYAVEYINGKAYTPTVDTDVSGGTWFTDVQCTTVATGTANGTTTYYKRENKTYKVIKVVAAP